MATKCSKTAITELMRVAWRTVGSILTRVWGEVEAAHDRLENVRRIGIDEISYKRGHKYLTVVVDHDSGSLLWAAAGRDAKTLAEFFDLLGPQRSAQITHVSADGAPWIAKVITERCIDAIVCADPPPSLGFASGGRYPHHVVRWATEALDEVRRAAWDDARTEARREPKRPRGRPAGDAPARPASQRATALKGRRYALWKNPQNLTERQQVKLAWVAKTDTRLYRAYLRLLRNGGQADSQHNPLC